jgi:hypothetical protein
MCDFVDVIRAARGGAAAPQRARDTTLRVPTGRINRATPPAVARAWP